MTIIYIIASLPRLESLLMTCDCVFSNRPKNLGQNRRQSICLKRLQKPIFIVSKLKGIKITIVFAFLLQKQIILTLIFH